jgi:hypothetical protein
MKVQLSVFYLVPQFIVLSTFTCLVLVIRGNVIRDVKLSLMLVNPNNSKLFLSLSVELVTKIKVYSTIIINVFITAIFVISRNIV